MLNRHDFGPDNGCQPQLAWCFRRLVPFIGPVVRRLREVAALSQKALADKADVARTTVCELENGKRTNIGIRFVEDIAHALGYTLCSVLTLADQDSQKAA